MKYAKYIWLILLVGAIGGLALFSANKSHQDVSSDTRQTVNTMAKPNTVTIQEFSFRPNKITVKKGTTLTWVNMDDAHHDITPVSGESDFKASRLLAKGESYQFTFNDVGTYTYKCSPHPYMKGTIEVTE